jgi:hypothetical protein
MKQCFNSLLISRQLMIQLGGTSCTISSVWYPHDPGKGNKNLMKVGELYFCLEFM